MRFRLLVLAFFSISPVLAVPLPQSKTFTNSIGMEFVRIESGDFVMGESNVLPTSIVGKVEAKRGRPRFPVSGDFDERPLHTVTLTEPFYLGVTEVTNEQFERFAPLHAHLRGKYGFSIDRDEAVVFVSWYEAKAFCEWLSKREGRSYRLPTEAEWEYSCRAGTTSPFSSGEALPESCIKNPTQSWYPVLPRSAGSREVVPLHVKQSPPNPWGLYDMHGNVEEWCLDGYGPYTARPQADPIGRAGATFKVTRGGSHATVPYYLRSANRMATLPDDRSWLIGLRVVLGESRDLRSLPSASPQPYQRDVDQQITSDVLTQPDSDKPYFEGPRNFIKISPGSMGPLFSDHNHHSAVVECPNGDLLALWFSTVQENGREMAIACSRLRWGAEEWDPASLFWNAPDRNDTGPALWFDGERTIYHFNGFSTAGTWGPLAVMMRTSVDNGVTWSKPRIILPEHRSRHQVVESAFKTAEGWLVLPCDATPSGSGGTSIHISKDGGYTWRDPGGTIGGIHAGVAQLTDGRLLAFGRGDEMAADEPGHQFPGRRRRDPPNEYRPLTQSISSDMGRTWSYSQGPFPPVSGGQRLVLTRLREGPLLCCSFANEIDDGRRLPPFLITDASGRKRPVRGLFAALSYDDGRTWPRIRLVSDDGPGREVGITNGRQNFTLSASNAEPKGYLSVCQARGGIVHLTSSWNHYAFNMKWLETPAPALPARQ
jgi:sulfatase modifying factor 1